MNLFAYGTLMCPEIMALVAGYCPASLTGRLPDYRRRRVRGEPYPAIIPVANASVEGQVYLDLPEPAWPRLDQFEGEMYRRRSVSVELVDGRMVSAEVYVFRPDLEELLDESGWSFEEFLSSGKEPFLREGGGAVD